VLASGADCKAGCADIAGSRLPLAKREEPDRLAANCHGWLLHRCEAVV